jgi:hypothetical protein
MLETNHATTQTGPMRTGKFRRDTTDMHRLRMVSTGHINLQRAKHWWQVHLFMITLFTFGGAEEIGRINRIVLYPIGGIRYHCQCVWRPVLISAYLIILGVYCRLLLPSVHPLFFSADGEHLDPGG